MAAKENIKVGVQVEGVKETIAAFKRLDKDAQKRSREKTKEISELLAKRIRAATPARDRRYQVLETSVRAGKDRVPVIRIGRLVNPKVSGGGNPASLVIGMEFGADQSGPNAWRFPPRTPRRGKGNQGYWIFPTATREQRSIVRLWQESLDPDLAKWAD